MCVVREVRYLASPCHPSGLVVTHGLSKNGNIDEVFKEDPLQEVIMSSTDDGSTDDVSAI